MTDEKGNGHERMKMTVNLRQSYAPSRRYFASRQDHRFLRRNLSGPATKHVFLLYRGVLWAGYDVVPPFL